VTVVDVRACIPVEVDRLGFAYCLLHVDFLFGLFFKLKMHVACSSEMLVFIFTALHGVIAQKKDLFLIPVCSCAASYSKAEMFS
jgi:hypothetical protein